MQAYASKSCCDQSLKEKNKTDFFNVG